jgi:hypothetical protein
MILNTYALIDALLCLPRLVLGLLVAVFALALYVRSRGSADDPARREAFERGYTVLVLTAATLALLVVASWPLFYLLLQSYVGEWPGLRCVYGVTRIGEGSVNSSRFLPPLVTALEWVKPALVFLCGAGVVLHVLNRSTRTAPLTTRVLLIVAATALLATADAAAEGAYLLIPKKEVFPSAGCCGVYAQAGAGADRFVPRPLLGTDPGLLLTAYYAANAALLLGFRALGPRPGQAHPGFPLAALLALVSAATVVEAVFVVDVMAPRLLGDPNHHCPYDLITAAPVCVLGVLCFLGSWCCVAWAGLAVWFGRAAEPVPNRSAVVVRLCQAAFFGYITSFALQWAELARC